MMSDFPHRITGPIGAKGTLGLIVLQSDETVEQDMRRLFPDPAVAFYTTRIPSGADVTPETLAAMEAELPQAASLLPPSVAFDAIGYACTSGATRIGADRVAELVSGSAATRAVTNPLTAAIAALRALDVGAFAFVSPYVASVAEPIRTAFAVEGFTVPVTLSFGVQTEAVVARIDPGSILEAGLAAGREPGVEAVFLSCTNLRTLDIIEPLEQALGKPVLSSNQVLAWHLARLAGAPVAAEAPGRLFGLRAGDAGGKFTAR